MGINRVNSEGDRKCYSLFTRFFWCFKRLVRNAHPTISANSTIFEIHLRIHDIRTMEMKITENDVRSALPDLTTTMRLPELGAAVEVYRDRVGYPAYQSRERGRSVFRARICHGAR